MAKPKILIAEDDALLRSIYQKKFALGGYDIQTVCDGEEALNVLATVKPDMLILDINMPKVDGFQVLEHFPKETRTFPIIMLTNFDQVDYRTKGAELGADEFFIKKDMTIHSLLDMVDVLLKKAKK